MSETTNDARALYKQGFQHFAKGELEPADLAQVKKLCLVLGNEHDGIRDALAQAADRSVRIPMRGFVESLNVSVAAAVLLAAAAGPRPGDLPDRERRLLYARGLYQTVNRAAEVLEASEIPADPASRIPR